MALPNEKFEEIKSKIQKFVDKEMVPHEQEFSVNHKFADHLSFLEEKRNLVRKMGLFTPQIPKEHGGLGLSLYQLGQIYEILGKTFYGLYVFNCQAPDAGNMEILIEHGTDYQKETFLKPLVDGKIRSCFSMTEPDHAGSNPIIMGTTAVKDGSNFVINGHKWFTSSADGADFAIVMVITDPKNDAVAPKDIKTNENPNANNIIGKTLTLFLSSNSFKALPQSSNSVLAPFISEPA